MLREKGNMRGEGFEPSVAHLFRKKLDQKELAKARKGNAMK